MIGDGKLFNLRNTCMLLYGLNAAGVLMQFFVETTLLGLLLIVIAYIVTRDRRKYAANTPYETHLQWLTRTFWIGTGVVMPLAVIVATVLVLLFTDVSSVATADPDALMGGIFNYLHSNIDKINLLMSVSTVPTAVWWVHRCWVGFVFARGEEPVKNVRTWL